MRMSAAAPLCAAMKSSAGRAGPCVLRTARQSIRSLAVQRVRLSGADLPALLLLEYEHALAVPGGSVPVLRRGCVEISEDENAKRGGQRSVRRPVFRRIAANVVRRAEFAAANLGQGIP